MEKSKDRGIYKVEKEKNKISGSSYKIDAEFYNLINFIDSKTLDQMTDIIKNNFEYRYNNDIFNYINIQKYYNEHKLWGSLDIKNGDIEVIKNNAKALVEHKKDFEWLYNNLSDYRSKKILVAVLYYWLWLDYNKVTGITDSNFPQYFDLDIIKCDQNEIFVDIGAYVGDTAVSYCETYGFNCFSKIYCYEISDINISYIKKNINKFKIKNIEIVRKGASDKNSIMYLEEDKLSSVNMLNDSGKIKVNTVKIDDDIEGRVTFIKMDIEGGEEKALIGCSKKIKKYHPKLALSVYHNNDHLYKIAQMIRDIDKTYKFYLRYYGGKVLPTEYILYAI